MALGRKELILIGGFVMFASAVGIGVIVYFIDPGKEAHEGTRHNEFVANNSSKRFHK